MSAFFFDRMAEAEVVMGRLCVGYGGQLCYSFATRLPISGYNRG